MGDYFPSLNIDQGAAEVNMAREIIKPVFSRLREIRIFCECYGEELALRAYKSGC